MAIESATYINQLNQSYPDGTIDLMSSVDDHIRLIKKTLQNSFPGVTGPVITSQTDLSSTKYTTVTGTANAITATISNWPGLSEGVGLTFKAAATNTGATTLNVNSTGAVPLVTSSNRALVGGEIRVGATYTVRYNGSSFIMDSEALGYLDNSLAYADSAGTLYLTNGNRTNGNLYLNGSTSNTIFWNTAGVSAPTYTSRSIGTKLVLYPGLGGASVDYAMGIENSTLWSSVPNSASQFKWYAGTTAVMTLSGGGALSTTSTITAQSGLSTNTGNITASAGDLVSYRSGAAHTGIVWLGNGGRYVHFDGSNYQMPHNELYTVGRLVATYLNNSLTNIPSYMQFQNGLKIMFGKTPANSSGYVTINLPWTMSNTSYYIGATGYSAATAGMIITSQTTTQFQIFNGGSPNANVSWLIVGY